ncbi:MAG: hypothetical protein R3E34_01835 [Rhodocyclaceae bacterium]
MSAMMSSSGQNSTPAQGAIVDRGLAAMLGVDFVDVHRAGFGTDTAFVALVVGSLAQTRERQEAEGGIHGQHGTDAAERLTYGQVRR